MNLETPKRRTVLKGIGTGVVGSLAFSGAAAAADLEIDLVGDAFNFDPRRASIDVSGGSKTVRWTYVTKGGPAHPHDVHIAESNSLNTVYVKSGHGNLDTVGEEYSVTFQRDGDDLVISDGDETGTVTGAFSGSSSYTVDYVCSLHAAGMFGHLTVNG